MRDASPHVQTDSLAYHMRKGQRERRAHSMDKSIGWLIWMVSNANDNEWKASPSSVLVGSQTRFKTSSESWSWGWHICRVISSWEPTILGPPAKEGWVSSPEEARVSSSEEVRVSEGDEMKWRVRNRQKCFSAASMCNFGMGMLIVWLTYLKRCVCRSSSVDLGQARHRTLNHGRSRADTSSNPKPWSRSI